MSAELLGLAAQDLACYSTLLWPSFELARHTDVLVSELEAVERGEVTRLLVSMPPQHGKSLETSIQFPSWYLGRNPDRAVVGASHSQELADGFGRRVRNNLLDPRHRAVFPGSRMSEDSTAASRFDLSSGGSYFAIGRGGGLTGRGADLVIIDDPIKDLAEASSAAVRQALKDWYSAVVYTRLRPGAAIVVVATRWHQDDLAGWLLAEHPAEGWRVINLPAIAETDGADWRKEGEALWPQRYPVPALERYREQLGPWLFASLYQGRPVPLGGAIFKAEWFGSYQGVPDTRRVIQAWDTGFKTGGNHDYSSCVTIGESASAFYVLNVWRGRLEFPELKRKIADIAAEWKPGAVLVEDKASGQSLIQELKRETRLPILPAEAQGAKELRAQLVTPLIEAGKVHLPTSAPWRASFIDELITFPTGAHDDQVDAFVHGLTYLRARGAGGFRYASSGEGFERSAREWRSAF
ncbi:MAG TPA: phage terminase large subunit [Thermoanaerobaculia bacterium]|nr:phage terminase large subunit [Thermoanaerobaculia bacterium]HEV8608848.1 phage terminase large subunit [Thermoanaerobaculia bacterium]